MSKKKAIPITYKTPGVYIEELDAFPGSIIAVETAVPAFIGYTAKALRKGKPLVGIPVKISSFNEYTNLFGDEGLEPKFSVAKTDKGEWDIQFIDKTKAFMFSSIKLFFSNGGGNCYIVSVGTYGETKDAEGNPTPQEFNLVKEDILNGIVPLKKELEPTIIVIPDAVLLDDDECYDIYKTTLKHCGDMQNRVAILDVYNGYQKREGEGDEDVITNFRSKTGSENLDYACAYYPWLDTSVFAKNDVTWTKIEGGIETLKNFCKEELVINFMDKAPAIDDKFTSKDFHSDLFAVSPTYSDILDEIREKMNLLPASSAMAGVYTVIDNNRGVWKAPANTSLNNVVKPAVNITHEEQQDLNVHAQTGKSINAIRTFPGIGTLVWGARTLKGNSLDWRYINVRRTMIMLEQSIKLALQSYVFEPNDANTWVTVKSMIVNFLTEKWKQGALAGSTPEDAFDVQIGLGSTMTSLDILEGRMLVTVKVAIVRPAEFIVVTFQQQMQKS
jgi:phage tail sheath protein FI